MKKRLLAASGRRLLVGLVLAWAPSTLAQDVAGGGTLSLQILLKNQKSQASAADIKARASALAQARAASAAKPEASLAAELEGARAMTRTEGEEPAASGTLYLSKTFRLGVDDEALSRQAEAEAQAETQEVLEALRAHDSELAHAYVALRHQQKVAVASKGALDRLAPLVSVAESGSARGTGSALAALKWRLLQDKVKSVNVASEASFKELAATLGKSAGASLGANVYTARLEAVPAVTLGGEAAAGKAPELRALSAREAALQNAVGATGGVTQVEGAVGFERDFTSSVNAVLFRVSVPLDQGSANEARSKALVAERELLGERRKVVERRLLARVATLESQARAKAQDIAALERFRAGADRIARTSATGLRQGLSELSEVMESIEATYEADLSLAEAQRGLDEVLAELYIIAGDNNE